MSRVLGHTAQPATAGKPSTGKAKVVKSKGLFSKVISSGKAAKKIAQRVLVKKGHAVSFAQVPFVDQYGNSIDPTDKASLKVTDETRKGKRPAKLDPALSREIALTRNKGTAVILPEFKRRAAEHLDRTNDLRSGILSGELETPGNKSDILRKQLKEQRRKEAPSDNMVWLQEVRNHLARSKDGDAARLLAQARAMQGLSDVDAPNDQAVQTIDLSGAKAFVPRKLSVDKSATHVVRGNDLPPVDDRREKQPVRFGAARDKEQPASAKSRRSRPQSDRRSLGTLPMQAKEDVPFQREMGAPPAMDLPEEPITGTPRAARTVGTPIARRTGAAQPEPKADAESVSARRSASMLSQLRKGVEQARVEGPSRRQARSQPGRADDSALRSSSEQPKAAAPQPERATRAVEAKSAKQAETPTAERAVRPEEKPVAPSQTRGLSDRPPTRALLYNSVVEALEDDAVIPAGESIGPLKDRSSRQQEPLPEYVPESSQSTRRGRLAARPNEKTTEPRTSRATHRANSTQQAEVGDRVSTDRTNRILVQPERADRKAQQPASRSARPAASAAANSRPQSQPQPQPQQTRTAAPQTPSAGQDSSTRGDVPQQQTAKASAEPVAKQTTTPEAKPAPKAEVQNAQRPAAQTSTAIPRPQTRTNPAPSNPRPVEGTRARSVETAPAHSAEGRTEAPAQRAPLAARTAPAAQPGAQAARPLATDTSRQPSAAPQAVRPAPAQSLSPESPRSMFQDAPRQTASGQQAARPAPVQSSNPDSPQPVAKDAPRQTASGQQAARPVPAQSSNPDSPRPVAKDAPRQTTSGQQAARPAPARSSNPDAPRPVAKDAPRQTTSGQQTARPVSAQSSNPDAPRPVAKDAPRQTTSGQQAARPLPAQSSNPDAPQPVAKAAHRQTTSGQQTARPVPAQSTNLESPRPVAKDAPRQTTSGQQTARPVPAQRSSMDAPQTVTPDTPRPAERSNQPRSADVRDTGKTDALKQSRPAEPARAPHTEQPERKSRVAKPVDRPAEMQEGVTPPARRGRVGAKALTQKGWQVHLPGGRTPSSSRATGEMAEPERTQGDASRPAATTAAPQRASRTHTARSTASADRPARKTEPSEPRKSSSPDSKQASEIKPAAAQQTQSNTTAQQAARPAAPAGNLAATSHGVENLQQVLDAVKTRARIIKADGSIRAHIPLRPEGLGELRLEVIKKNGRYQLILGTKSADTAKVLERAMPQLKDALAAAGISLDKADIEVGSPRPMAAQSDGDTRTAQQDRRDSSQQGDSSGSRDRNRNGSFDRHLGRDDVQQDAELTQGNRRRPLSTGTNTVDTVY